MNKLNYLIFGLLVLATGNLILKNFSNIFNYWMKNRD